MRRTCALMIQLYRKLQPYEAWPLHFELSFCTIDRMPDENPAPLAIAVSRDVMFNIEGTGLSLFWLCHMWAHFLQLELVNSTWLSFTQPLSTHFICKRIIKKGISATQVIFLDNATQVWSLSPTLKSDCIAEFRSHKVKYLPTKYWHKVRFQNLFIQEI